MIEFGKPTSIPEVTAAIKTQLVSELSWDASLVFEGFDDVALDAFPLQRSSLSIYVQSFVPLQGDVEGGGSELTTGTLDVLITLRWQSAMDLPGQDVAVVQNASYGPLPTWLAMVKALQVWYPVDANASIFVEPMRMVASQFFGKKPRGDGWSHLPTQWMVPVVLNLK